MKTSSAVRENKKTFNFINDQVSFKNVRYSLYRVWCLKELEDIFKKLQKIPNQFLKTYCKEILDASLGAKGFTHNPFKADSKMIGVTRNNFFYFY